MFKRRTSQWVAFSAALLVASSAHAHPGHDLTSFSQAFAHPFSGFDHLLAMLAVGVWSVAALPTGKRIAGPAVFMTMLLVGVMMAWFGMALPGVEIGVALSVTLFGVMLLAAKRLKPAVGLLMVGVAAVLHGAAHGNELPAQATTALMTVLGIALGSGLLHAVGLLAGVRLLTLPAWITRLSAALLSAAGVVMLAARL